MPGVGAPPLYMLIRRDLQRRIVTGDLQVGDWLPSETQLQTTYRVSQTPVRRALSELEQMGLIERQKGRGSMVRSREIVAVHPMVGFGTELRNQGRDVEVRVLSIETLAANKVVAEELGCTPGDEVYRVTRLFLLDGEPFSFFEHHFGARLAPHLRDLEPSRLESLYGFMSQVSLEPTWAREQITAAAVPDELASLLHLEPGAPALLRIRTAYLADSEAVEFTRYWVRPDLYSISVELRNVWT